MTEQVDTPTPEAAPDNAKPSLEDLLAGLDEDARGVVLGEVEKARKEAQGLRKRVKEAEPIVSQFKALEAASQTEAERQQAALAAVQTHASTLAQRVVRAEVKALAADFADPSDAETFLDLGSYLDDDLDVDTDRIKADLADLLKRKPHLAKVTGPRSPRPDPSQGSGANGASAADPAQQFAALIQSKFAT